MACGTLRSHYVSKVRGLVEGQEVLVRWYPCRPGAKPLPLWSMVVPHVWEPAFDDEEIGRGELNDPHDWRPKAYPAPPGLDYHGQPEWFLTGVPPSEVSQEEVTDLCGQPIDEARSGMVLGGSAAIDQEVIVARLIVQKTTQSTLTTPGVLDLDDDGTAYRIQASGPMDVYGLAGGVNGRLVILGNIGTQPIFLLNESGLAPAGQRIICQDAIACRLWPRTETWLEYDGDSLRWRELRTVPLVNLKGDLITHDGTVPHVLHTSGTDGNVLTEDSTKPNGIDWKPPAGAVGGDWWYWVPGSIDDSPTERWAVAGLGTGQLAGDESLPPDVLLAMPLPRPRGGTIDKVAVYVNTIPGGGTYLMRFGIYSNLGPGLAYPDARLVKVDDVDYSPLGAIVWTLGTPLTVDPGSLLWFIILLSDGFGGSVVSSVAVAGGAYPVLGVKDPSDLNPGIGWQAGFEPGGMDPNTWPYGDGLPATFPAYGSIANIDRLTTGGSPSAPAIFVHMSG